jgi:hypothetical protein
LGHAIEEDIDRRAQIARDVLEVAQGTRTVAHASIIEAQRSEARACQMPGQVHELPMTADTVLRAADHYDGTGFSRLSRHGGDADQRVSLAVEHQRAFC